MGTPQITSWSCFVAILISIQFGAVASLADDAPAPPAKKPMLSARVEAWLKNMLAALPERVPASAKWCRFTVTRPKGAWLPPEQTETIETCGWLLGEEKGMLRVVDWYDKRQSWPREKVKVRPESLAQFAERVQAVRADYNASRDPDKKRAMRESMGFYSFMISSHSEWGGTVPEFLVAAWSLERGDRETAARLLVPLLVEQDSEVEFLDASRDQFAMHLDSHMLDAFTARDYAEALRLAKLLAVPFFNGFAHQDRAIGLAATLPNRQDDFGKLALVSPGNWKFLKETISRAKQIEFLAKRLRLIHAVQMSVPGGIDYSDDQTLDKPRKSYYMAIDPNDRSEPRPAINPYTELLKMNLTGAELATLLPLLDSPDYILAFDRYRFLPMGPQNLHKVSWVAAAILNEVTSEDLVDFSVLNGSSQKDRDFQLDRIREWCKAHAAETHAQRLAAKLKEAKNWDDAQSPFWRLYELDADLAIKLVVAFFDQHPERTPQLARLVYLLDRQEFLPRAEKWMAEENEETRFWGALFHLRHSDRKKPVGLEIVLAQLANELDGKGSITKGEISIEVEQLVDSCIDELLAVDDPRVRQFLSKYIGEKPHERLPHAFYTLQACFRAGHKPALDQILHHLADKTPQSMTDPRPESDQWLWWISCWRYKDPPGHLYALPQEKRAEAYADLQAWLAEQFARIQAGKEVNLVKEDRRLPWGNLRGYSSGWVRRL